MKLRDTQVMFEKDKMIVQARALSWIQSEIGEICKRNRWELRCLYWIQLFSNGQEIHAEFSKDAETIFALITWYERQFCPYSPQMICDKGDWI